MGGGIPNPPFPLPLGVHALKGNQTTLTRRMKDVHVSVAGTFCTMLMGSMICLFELCVIKDMSVVIILPFCRFLKHYFSSRQLAVLKVFFYTKLGLEFSFKVAILKRHESTDVQQKIQSCNSCFKAQRATEVLACPTFHYPEMTVHQRLLKILLLSSHQAHKARCYSNQLSSHDMGPLNCQPRLCLGLNFDFGLMSWLSTVGG